MAAPEGYTKLGLIGYTDKGTYSDSSTYNRYNVVLFEGSSYVALKDNLTGVEPANDGTNWRIFAQGFNIENAVTTDNFQTTLQNYIANNGTTNQAGFAADARQLNPNIEGSLAKQVSELNANGPTYFYLRYNSTNGYLDLSYIYVKDLVILAGIFVINIETPQYSITGNVPKSIIPNGFLVYDTLGEYRFQINPRGIFQNSDALPAGTYIVTTAYIKS